MSSYLCKNEQCSLTTFLDKGWDSYFCAICNSWNEDKCSDLECDYCTNRPVTPLNHSAHSVFFKCYTDIGFKGVVQLVEYYLELEEEHGSINR